MVDTLRIAPGQQIPTPDAVILGGKAFQQALASSDGLPVVPAVVLTSCVFPGEQWLSEHPGKDGGEAVREYLRKRHVDLVAELAWLGGPPYAVRSSATAEDLAEASFAGSFVSVIGVSNQNVYSAVYQVWASTFSERVHKYMSARGLDDRWDNLRMAVLIQPVVDSLLSGVALSYPLGQPQSPYISVGVVRGMGEQLVSGDVEPQTFLIERLSWALVECRDAIDTPLVHEFAAQIGRTVCRLETHRGQPQDIEFAISQNFDFCLLQNRPIAESRS